MNKEQIAQKRPNGTLELTSEATLTRREQFAAMAMQGLVAHCYFDLKQERCALSQQQTANIAVNLADALIARLDKGGSDE